MQPFNLSGHLWLPPKPPDTQDDVLFSKESRANQYWRREDNWPDYFMRYNPNCLQDADKTVWDRNEVLVSLSREDTATLWRLFDREMVRRQRGVWFMNDGVPTYLTGDHYFQLQWGAMFGYVNPDTGDPYGEYREFQAHYQYFLSHCWESTDQWGDRNCAGQLTVKPKKTGITQVVALNFLNHSTMMKQRLFGMMSKSDDDVRLTNFNYYTFAFDNLPAIFKPTIAKRNESEISFGAPTVRVTGSAANLNAQLQQAAGLKNSVFTKSLRANAFDGPPMWEVWLDEWCKYIGQATPAEVYKQTIQVVKLQDKIRGLSHSTSYVTETDSKAFVEAKEIWKQAQLETLDKTTGRTKNELFAYFINAAYSGETGFDRHGRANVEKNTARIQAKRAQLKNEPSELQAQMRQFPLTPEEAWRAGGGGDTTYNNIRLGKRKEAIEDGIRKGELLYTEGFLEWKDGIRLSEVWFRPITREEIDEGKKAPFRIYGWEEYWKHNPDLFNRAFRRNIRDRAGRLMPGEDTPFCGATDPTEYALATGLKVASKQASTVMSFPDAALNGKFQLPITNRFICTYLYRHENPKDSYEDVVKKIYFFSCYEAIEGNREWMRTMAIQDKLHNFLLVWNRAKKCIEVFNEHSKDQTVIRAGGGGDDGIIADYVRAKTNYYARVPEGEPDYLDLMEDERILDSDMNFNPADTRSQDMSVCSSWNILALQSFGPARFSKAPERWMPETGFDQLYKLLSA